MTKASGNPCLINAVRSKASGPTAIVQERKHPLRGSARELMDFELWRPGKGRRRAVETTKETVWVLMSGRARVRFDGSDVEVSRGSIFDEAPTVVHAGPGERVEFGSAAANTEWAVVAASGSRVRGVRLYRPDEIGNEDRGAGLAQDACRRTVRTIFDYSSRPDSQLVIGEVVNRAGRWSSYPPHHHPQPEVYHYRFTEPQGYGHAELGDDVVKVRHGDTTLIQGGLDHAQVAAPGYGMYYLWIVRHLPRRPYRGFTFTPAHRWLLDPSRQGWAPS